MNSNSLSARHSSRPCPVIAETPMTAAHFFGYHDLCPWDPTNKQLAILRVDPALGSVPDGSEPAEICLWTPESGAVTVIGETRAWNWQQGARQQWLPGDGRRLIYNRHEAGRLGAVIADLDSGSTTTLPVTVSAVAPDGLSALSPHFARLARYWPSYGMAGEAPPGIDAECPDDDGLWRLDLASGAVELMVSVAAAAAVGGERAVTGTAHFLTHPSFSPTGRRICFLHRFFTPDGALYSRLLVGRPDGGELMVIADEKVSHFDWLNDRTILVWTRELPRSLAAARRGGLLATPLIQPLLNLARKLRPGFKQMLLSEAYFMADIEAHPKKSAMARGLLERDGHPMFTNDRRWMITDTYPDHDRMQTLILYDVRNNRRIDIGRFHADPGAGEGDMKCDLHPRWDRDERLVCIDSTDRGLRQCLIVDTQAILN